jgi:hypothetical protein
MPIQLQHGSNNFLYLYIGIEGWESSYAASIIMCVKYIFLFVHRNGKLGVIICRFSYSTCKNEFFYLYIVTGSQE